MIAATLFSGIGAPEAAMPSWDWRWHAEIEPFASAVMKQRHPQSINIGDVNAEDFVERAERAGRPDVLIFGSPCQSFSVAGKRLGLDDPRGNMALVALGIARELRPRWLVFENVPGLFSSYSGGDEAEREVRKGAMGDVRDGVEDSDFAAFLSTVRECGYLGCYRVFDAQYSGVPQRRRRVFFVGYLGDWRPAAAVLLEPESLRGDRPPSRETGQRTAADTADSIGESSDIAKSVRGNSGGIDREDMHTLITGAVSSKWSKGTGGPAGDECYNLVAFSCKDYGNDCTEDVAPPLRAMNEVDGHANAGGQVAVAFQTRVARNGRGNASDAVGYTITPSQSNKDYNARAQDRTQAITTNGNRPSARGGDLVVSIHENQRAEMTTSDTAGSLKTSGGKPGQGYPATFTGTAVRRLLPVECERLQGFPDGWTAVRYRGKLAADGNRYRALGNSMAVPVIRSILERIELFDKLGEPKPREEKR